MARTTVVTLVDDMNGAEGDEVKTIQFGFNGLNYEIDLGPKNAEKLTKFLTPYVEKARKVNRVAVSPRKSRNGAKK